MKKKLEKLYLEQCLRYQGKERLLHTVAYHVAPVLENVKPAVLLVFSSGKDNLKALWQSYRRELVKEIPLDFYQLSYAEKRPCSSLLGLLESLS